MTPSQTESLNLVLERRPNSELFYGVDGSVIVKSDKYIESVGTRGGITMHILMHKGKITLNGVYSKN